MITFVINWPGVEEMKRKVQNAKYFNFYMLPVPSVDQFDFIGKDGFIGFLSKSQDIFDWESTIAYWMNRIHEQETNPIELHDRFLIEDIGTMMSGKSPRLTKSEYEEWILIYDFIKKNILHGTRS